MKNRIGLTIALLALVAFPVLTWAQQGTTTEPGASVPAETGAEHGHHQGHGHQHGHDMHKGNDDGHGEGYSGRHRGGRRGMMQKCMAMKEKSDKAMEDIKAMDDRIQEKMAALKNSTGDRKMAAMEAVLGELVTQRKELREKLGDLHHHRAMCGMMGRGGHHGGMTHGGMKGKCPMMGGMEHHTGHRGGDGDGVRSEVVN